MKIDTYAAAEANKKLFSENVIAKEKDKNEKLEQLASAYEVELDSHQQELLGKLNDSQEHLSETQELIKGVSRDKIKQAKDEYNTKLELETRRFQKEKEEIQAKFREKLKKYERQYQMDSNKDRGLGINANDHNKITKEFDRVVLSLIRENEMEQSINREKNQKRVENMTELMNRQLEEIKSLQETKQVEMSTTLKDQLNQYNAEYKDETIQLKDSVNKQSYEERLEADNQLRDAERDFEKQNRTIINFDA